MKQLLIFLSFFFCVTLSSQEFYTTIGAAFPSFEIVDLNEVTITNSTLKGKPTLLVFFGTRCPPCLKELQALDAQLPFAWYQQFNIYAVGSTDNAERLIKFNNKKNYKFKYLPDPNQELFDRIGDHTIPRTFLLDANGNIVSQTVGFYKTPFESLLTRMRGMI